MAVESDVSVEVAASVEEKSCQDLVKPDCSLVKHGDQVNGSDSSRVLDVNGLNVEKLGVGEDSSVESVPGVELRNGDSDVLFDGSVEERENGNVEEQNGEMESGDASEVTIVNGFRDGSVENLENGVGVEDSRDESVPVVEFREGNSDVLAVEEGGNGNVEEQNGEIISGTECAVLSVNGSCDGSVENEENGVSVDDSVEPVPVVEFRDGYTLAVEEGENGNAEEPNGEIESEVDCEVPLMKVVSGKLESLAGAEIEMNADQEGNFEGVAETEEKVEEFVMENGDPAALENPGTRVGEVELAAETVEKELNVQSSHNESDNEDGECEDQNNRDSTETSEVYNGCSHLVSSAIRIELEEEITEAQDEPPLATSMVSDYNEEILTEKEELRNLSSHVKAGNAAGECENQIISNETLSTRSSDAVVDAVKSGLQETSTDGQSKADLIGELIECSECEVPVSISVDAGPECFSVDEEKMLKENGESNNLASCRNAAECEVTLVKLEDSNVDLCPTNTEETLDKENAKITVAFDVAENQKQVDEVTSLVSSTDQHVETDGGLVSDEKYTVCISVSNVEDTVQYHEEPEKHFDVTEASHVPTQFVSETEDSLPTQSLPISHVNKPHIKINMSGAETLDVVSSPPANGPQAESVDVVSSPPDSMLDTVVCSEKEPAFRSGVKQNETEVSGCKSKIVHIPSATVDMKLDHAKAQTSFSVTYKKDLLESFNINREAASNITWGSTNIKFGTADIEDNVDKSDDNLDISDGHLMLKENKHTDIFKHGNVSMASSGTDEVSGEKLSIKPATNPFHYLVKVPRFNDESLKERIKLQQIQLDVWTEQRDAIQVLIQSTRKANNQTHVRSAWKLVRSKRVEIDSLQFQINKVKSAASIQDIDQRICSIEYMMQHESMPLKEEKQLIHEIKQQKQLRKQLSSNIGSHDKIKESLEQLETLEERMKILKKEYGILKGNAEKAEAAFVEAKKKCDDEYKELQARHRVSNNSRQEAYNQLKSLRKELKEKNKYFYKYKDDATAANNYAHSKDRDALHSQCKNQVEKFMELWNNNDKFRKEYVTFNARSTVRKFGTLDGRALGPNEERPIMPSYVDQKVHKMISTPAKIDSVSKTLVLELKQEMKLENGISKEKTNGISEEKIIKKLTKPKGLVSANDKEAAEPVSTTVSSKHVSEEVQVEVEPTKSEEEIELERKAEEMRRQDEAKLKEKLRLEEIAKAQEAREMKKLKEEKEKRRAELRARKEAEQKEKEREKRLRKKEKKNASTAVTAESSNNIDPAPMPENIIETAQGIEQPKEASTTSKKSQRHIFTKRNKPRVTQPPLRIRRKRNWIRNPWFIIPGIFIVAAINIIFLYNTYLK